MSSPVPHAPPAAHSQYSLGPPCRFLEGFDLFGAARNEQGIRARCPICMYTSCLCAFADFHHPSPRYDDMVGENMAKSYVLFLPMFVSPTHSAPLPWSSSSSKSSFGHMCMTTVALPMDAAKISGLLPPFPLSHKYVWIKLLSWPFDFYSPLQRDKQQARDSHAQDIMSDK